MTARCSERPEAAMFVRERRKKALGRRVDSLMLVEQNRRRKIACNGELV